MKSLLNLVEGHQTFARERVSCFSRPPERQTVLLFLPRLKALMDDLWLDGLLSAQGSPLAPVLPPPDEQTRTPDQTLTPSLSRQRVDWGEALAVPSFYGRTSQLVQPEASAEDISSGIAGAFARNAELYDDNVYVSADSGHVTLSGTVETWGEYDMAEDVAWRSPGVTSVTNDILVNA